MTEEHGVGIVKDGIILSKVYGNSMFPALRSGSKIIAKKISFSDLKPFDIIIFKKRIFKVCHRILNIDNTLLLNIYTCYYTQVGIKV